MPLSIVPFFLPRELSSVRSKLSYGEEQGLSRKFSRVESLVLLPVQHIMRYRILFESIRSEYEREKRKSKRRTEPSGLPFPFTLEALRDATEVVSDLTECFNEYKRDTDVLDALSRELRGLRGLVLAPADNRIELDYGSLVYDGWHLIR